MTKDPEDRIPSQEHPFDSDDTRTSTACRASDDSPPTPLDKRNAEERYQSLTSDYQLTARLRMTLTRRQQSLLLDVLNYQAVHFGVSFGMYLFIEMLYSNLVGSKDHPVDVKDEYERRTTFVARIILASLDDTWLNLDDMLPLEENVRQRLLRGGQCLMSRRVYGSRFATWRPERFLEIKAVRLDVFIERSGNSSRYSSYTKGYGESHPSRHSQKTAVSPELDGEETGSKYPKFGLLDLPLYLHLNATELYRKFHRNKT